MLEKSWKGDMKELLFLCFMSHLSIKFLFAPRELAHDLYLGVEKWNLNFEYPRIFCAWSKNIFLDTVKC